MKIIITGATGLIGGSIVQKLLNRGDAVTILTRGHTSKHFSGVEYVKWTPGNEGNWEKSIEGKDGVIHLAGASIFGRRWNKEYKKDIIKSREVGTQSVVDAIAKARIKPSVIVTASGIGYYGKNTGDKIITETDPNGDDFLAKVCLIWETEAAKVEAYNVRRVSIRTAPVLDKYEGALKEMLLPFRLYFGGPLGSGTQWFSWIHIDDLSDIYIRSLDDAAIRGVINASAPNPVRMNTYAEILGKVMHRPSWFRVPEFLIKLIIGEAAEFVTGGQRIKPERLLNMNYQFKFPEVKAALEDLLK